MSLKVKLEILSYLEFKMSCRAVRVCHVSFLCFPVIHPVWILILFLFKYLRDGKIIRISLLAIWEVDDDEDVGRGRFNFQQF